MADAVAVAGDDPLSSVPIPPFSPSIFSEDFNFPDDYLQFDDEFFDFTLDNNQHPSEAEEVFNSTLIQSVPFDPVSSDPQFDSFVSDYETVGTESGSLLPNLLPNQGSGVSRLINFPSPDNSGNLLGNQGLYNIPCLDSGNLLGNQSLLNIPCLDSGNSLGDQGLGISRSLNKDMDNIGRDVIEVNAENPASSQGSKNCGSAGSEGAVICPSPDSGNSVVNQMNQKLKRESISDFVLKRKNESCDVDTECRTVKHQRSNETSTTSDSLNEANETDEKKRARQIRNRESAQLSRQRKKQYVEELEEKVRLMHATVQDLNARVAYIAAENAALKQQMVAGAGAGAGAGGGVYSPPVMYPPHPAMAPMGYPWMPYPPYMVKSQGSQVPLVPIPKLKTQQPEQKPKKDGKKTEVTLKAKTKTKKVASISFLGLLLFILLFGGLVPIMNVKFGGVTYSDRPPVKFNDHKFYNQQHHGRVLMGDEHVNGTNYNASEPLVASLYVPRNNKLVKIDGSLIINSVLASEKAMAFREKQEGIKEEDTGLAVAHLVPAIPVSRVNRNGGRQPHMYRTSSDYQRALPSNEENMQPKHADGKPQQWFREGLSGLMLSSGMCTEVFRFDTSVASASGAIVPATSAFNTTATENRHNSTSVTTVKNRRILPGLPIPLPDSTTNITKEQVSGHDSKEENHKKHNPASSVVVSVLVDPREAGDSGDVDGSMMGGGGNGRSFSRIFVVVLLDSVKYVTYSCMLPLKGSSHLVKA